MVYCYRCDRHFANHRALSQHEKDSYNHNICYPCAFDSPTSTGLEEHLVQSHPYCQYCGELFDYEEDLDEHLSAAHPFCGSCDRVFKDDRGLHEHNRQFHHYCMECQRVFLSASNLNAHLNSSTHRSKDFRCPFRVCALSFISRPAVILHLESGSCRSGATRARIDGFIREFDKRNLIINPARLITNGHDTSVTCTTSAAWNGSAYECYLCHKGHHTLHALNQHLASPSHQDKVYFCPLPSCRRQFVTLSALWQHVESESCGVSRFEAVQRAMDRLIAPVGRLAW